MRITARILGLVVAVSYLWGCGDDATATAAPAQPSLVNTWAADTAPTPATAYDALLASYLPMGAAAKVDTTRFTYTMVLAADSSYRATASLYLVATGTYANLKDKNGNLLPIPHHETIDSIYRESGKWSLNAAKDSLVITRSQCHLSQAPYVTLRDTASATLSAALVNDAPILKAAPEVANYVCTPVESRAKISIAGGVWPVTVSLPSIGPVTLKFKTK